jgi:hypothetical protein
MLLSDNIFLKKLENYLRIFVVWNLEMGKSTMGIILKWIGVVASLIVIIQLLCPPVFGTETKTAYTRDGINFVSKERMDENIKYEYAKPGEYREVQVPLDTIVVSASVIPGSALGQVKKETYEQEGAEPTEPGETIFAPSGENDIKYPYATLGIGLLLIVGLVVFAAWVINVRSHQRR